MKKEHNEKIFLDSWNVNDLERIFKESEKNRELPKMKLDKIEVHLTNWCNLNCSFCYGMKSQPKIKEPLKTEYLNEMFKSVLKINPFIIYSGMYNEPLTHPEFSNIIKNTGKYGYRFGLYTNGFLMNDKIAENIVSAGKSNMTLKPSYVTFNIGASIDINKTNYQISKIKTLTEKITDDSLVINATFLMVGDKTSYSDLEEIVLKLKGAKVDNIRIGTPWKEQNTGPIKGLNTLLQLQKNEGIDIRYGRNYKRCYTMAQSLAINSKGDVFPCPAICGEEFKNEFSFGNIYKEDIKDIWYGKRRKDLYFGLDPRKTSCKCCPVDDRFNNYCEDTLRFNR